LVVEHVGVTDLNRWREHFGHLTDTAIRARTATPDPL